MMETLWIWLCMPTACKECKKLEGRIYTKSEIPDPPHPNCRCFVDSISLAEADRLTPKMICGVFGDKQRAVTEEFEGGQRIIIRFKNRGLFGACVSATTNAETKRTGHMLPSQSATLEFSRFDYVPMHWKVSMTVEYGDPEAIWYRVVV